MGGLAVSGIKSIPGGTASSTPQQGRSSRDHVGAMNLLVSSVGMW